MSTDDREAKFWAADLAEARQQIAELERFRDELVKGGKKLWDRVAALEAELEKERAGWAAHHKKVIAALEAERDAARAALTRIRDDYGELWGGSITLRTEGETVPRMLCTYCGEYAPAGRGYESIVHDEDCAVTVAAGALKAMGTPTPVNVTPSAGELAQEAAEALYRKCGTPESLAFPVLVSLVEEARDTEGRRLAANLGAMAATPAAPMCKPWCGTKYTDHDDGTEPEKSEIHWTTGYGDDRRCYCSYACRIAGHPTTPTPTEETPR